MLDEPYFPTSFSKATGLSCRSSTLKLLHLRHGYAPDSLENLCTLCLRDGVVPSSIPVIDSQSDSEGFEMS